MSVSWRGWLVLTAFLLTDAAASGQKTERTASVRPLRIAVLVSDELPAARALQDLAMVKLSADRDLDLLERSAVDKLLREQKLSFSGLVDVGAALQAGKILAVDVLGIIDVSVATKKNVAFVVYDAVTGVRLVDQALNSEALDEQALETAAAVRRAVQAWWNETKHLKTVCFLPVRNADLPASLDSFCEAMATMLERQLLQHPGVAVLERKRLEGFTREKDLATAAASRELLASVLLLEMEFARGAEQKSIRATIVVRDPAAKVLHTLRHEVAEKDQAVLLEPLTQKLHKALNSANGAGVLKRSSEAQRFLREAETLWQYKRFQAALQAAEAAYALRGSDDARLLLAEYLLAHAHERLKPGVLDFSNTAIKPFEAGGTQVRTALNLALRADELIETSKTRGTYVQRLVGPWSLMETGNCFHNHVKFAGDLAYVELQPRDPQVDEEVRTFRLLAVQRDLERMRELAKRVPAKELEYMTNVVMTAYARQLVLEAPDSATAIKALREAFDIWLALSLQLTADEFPPICGLLLAQRVLPYFYLPPRREMQYAVADRAATLPALEALKKHPHPVAALYGEHFLVKQLLQLGKISDAEAEERCQQSITAAKAWIEKAPFRDQAGNRAALYQFIYASIHDHPTPLTYVPRLEAYFALVEHMVERRDVVGDVWANLANRMMDKSTTMNFHPRALAMLSRMRATLAGTPRTLVNPQQRLQRELDRVESLILQMSPHLAKERPGFPWEKVTRLVGLSSLRNVNAIIAPTRHGSDIYFLGGGYDANENNRPLLRLFKVPVAGGTIATLGETHVNLKDYDPKLPTEAFFGGKSFAELALVHDGHYCVGTKKDGILAFPLDGGPCRRIADDEGLPSLTVLKMIALENQLIAVLEDGYIIAYDLKGSRCKVIASSRRTQQLSPFDNEKRFYCSSLAADAQRRRVLMSIFQVSDRYPNSGIWEYDLTTEQFKKLLPLSSVQFSDVQEDRVFVRGHFFEVEKGAWIRHEYCGRLDLPANRFTLLTGVCPKLLEPQKAVGLPKDISAVFDDCVYHQNYLWKLLYFGRQAIEGGSVERLQHVYEGAGDIAASFLDVVNSDDMLFGDWRGLYRMRLKHALPSADMKRKKPALPGC